MPTNKASDVQTIIRQHDGGHEMTTTICPEGVRVECGTEPSGDIAGPIVTVMRGATGWDIYVRPVDTDEPGAVRLHVSDSDDFNPQVTIAGVQCVFNELYDDERDRWLSEEELEELSRARTE